MKKGIAFFVVNVLLLAVILCAAAQACLADAGSDFDTGFQLLNANNVTGAMQDFRSSINDDQTCVRAYQYLAWCYSRERDPADAIATAELGAQNAVLPRDAHVLKDLQGLLVDLYICNEGNAGKAVPVLNGLIGQFPSELVWQAKLGNCYRQLGRYSDAESTLLGCISAATSAGDAVNLKLAKAELTETYVEDRMCDKAIAAANDYIANYPDDPQIPDDLARVYQMKGITLRQPRLSGMCIPPSRTRSRMLPGLRAICALCLPSRANGMRLLRR